MMSRARRRQHCGFESVCEAMFLVSRCSWFRLRGILNNFANAHDAFKPVREYLMTNSTLVNLPIFLPLFNGTNQWFQNWVANAKLWIYNEIVGAWYMPRKILFIANPNTKKNFRQNRCSYPGIPENIYYRVIWKDKEHFEEITSILKRRLHRCCGGWRRRTVKSVIKQF